MVAQPEMSRSGFVGQTNRREKTGWAGWVIFAAVMLLITGTIQMIYGLTALFNDEFFAVRSDGLILHVDYTAWGWVHLFLGFLMIGGGLSLFTGGITGRIVGIVAASLSAIANLVFIAAYPVWSVVAIALDVIVIYAIVVHATELEE